MDKLYGKVETVLSEEDVQKAIKSYKENKSKYICEELFISHMPFIRSVIRKEMKRSKRFNESGNIKDIYDDYLQVAYLGFFNALNMYDLSIGKSKFSTYLFAYLSNYLRNYTLEMETSQINLNKRYYKEYTRLKVKEKEYIESNKKVDIYEILNESEFTKNAYDKYNKIFQTYSSGMTNIDEKAVGKKDNDKLSRHELIKDESYNVEEEVVNKLYLEKILSKLKEKEKDILILYFIHDITQPEIAKIYNIKQGRVSTIIKNSIKKLRREMGIVVNE